MHRYDSRPAPEALADRMRKDRLAGTVRSIVVAETSHSGNPYEQVESGVFSEDGHLLASYYSKPVGAGHRVFKRKASMTTRYSNE